MIIKKDSGSRERYIDKMLIVPTKQVLNEYRWFNRIAIDGFDNELVFRFDLLDSGSFSLKQSDFEACLERMSSLEFIDYCEMVNNCYNALIEFNDQEETVQSFVSGDSNYWDDERSSFAIVHDLILACEEYNTLNESRWEMKNSIIDDWSYNTWVETCRVYESMFGISRADI